MVINVIQLMLWIVQLAFFGLVDWFQLLPREAAVVVSVLPGVIATTLVVLEGGKKNQRMIEVALGFIATIESWFTADRWWWWLPVALVAIWNCSQVFLVLFLNLAQVAEAVARVRAGKPAPQAPQPQAQQSTPQKGKGGFFSKFRRKG